MQHLSNSIHNNFMLSQFYLKNWLIRLCMVLPFAISTAFAQIPPYHIAWEKTYGSNYSDFGFYVLSTPEGYCFIGGSDFNLQLEDRAVPIADRRTMDVSPPYKGLTGGWIVWTDKDGNIIRDRLYGGNITTSLYAGLYENDQYTFIGSTNSPPSLDVSEPGWKQKDAPFPWNDYINRDLWVITTDATGNRLWDKRYGGPGGEHYQTGFARTREGGLILIALSIVGYESIDCVGGMVSTPCYGPPETPSLTDGWVIKIGPDGRKVWDKRLGGSLFDYLSYIQVYPNGDILLLSGTNSPQGHDISTPPLSRLDPTNPLQDAWVVKLDANGNKLWDKRYGGSNEDGMTLFGRGAGGGGGGGGLHLMPDGGFMMLLYSASGPYIMPDGTLAGIGPPDGNKTAPTKIGTFIAGDYWLVRCDKDGNILWNKTYGGFNDDCPWTLVPYTDDKLLLVGVTYSPISGNRTNGSKRDTARFAAGLSSNTGDCWVVCIDTAGNTCWDMIIGGASRDWTYSCAVETNGCFVLAGFTNSDAGFGDRRTPLKLPNRTDDLQQKLVAFDYWGVKVCPDEMFSLDQFNLQGWLINNKVRLSIKNNKEGTYIIETANQYNQSLFKPIDTLQLTETILPHSTTLDLPTPGVWYYRLRRLGSNELSNTIAIQVPEDPQSFDRLTIVPSIAESNGTCTIYYPTPSNNQSGPQLTIFNASGQNLFSTDLDPHQNHYTLDLQAFPPGIYAIQINGNQSIQTEKLVIAR
jgi:hypothetical protein